ncbi:hypothetical protein [Pseudorhodoferax sp. Leaf265]|uniref:hypothetical protein n=1 Tax=Pseudorhodoferax sp. Leaf265 TaxID=1736315 RepID=UPI0006F69031|nr:hypothetical protein [Pseudorhodoferax sp. Leaf265]KQP12033.1 hypothetical protein ASF45_32005 [Pseudorhodoferax sp. Leaf265]
MALVIEGRCVIHASKRTAKPTVTVRVTEVGRALLERFDAGGRLTIRTPPPAIEVFRQQVALPSSAQTMDAARVVAQRRSRDGDAEVVECTLELAPGSSIEERHEF